MAGKFIVLTYHRVTELADPLRPGMCHASHFRAQMMVLRRHFNVLTLGDAVRHLDAATLPARSVVISFDDGYRDNHDVALPLLQEASLPATFFIASGYLNGGVMWNDYVFEAVRARPQGDWDLSFCQQGTQRIDGQASRIAAARTLIKALKYRPQQEREQLARQLGEEAVTALGEPLMMTDAQVAALAGAGMEIGAHTVTHPILNEVSDAQVRDEMIRNRADLCDLSGQDVTLFAYPNGKRGVDYSARHAQLAADVGFDAAFTTQWGFVGPDSLRYEMPRIGLEDEIGWRFAVKLVRAFWQPADLAA